MDSKLIEYLIAAFIGAVFIVGFIVFSSIAFDLKNEAETKDKQIEALGKELSIQQQRVYFLEVLAKHVFAEVPTYTMSTEVTVTAYSAHEDQTNEEPWFTADMSLSRVGILAVSRDLLDVYGIDYGDTVILEKYGVFRVHDTMNKRYTKRVDILMANREAAMKFGKQKDTLVWARRGNNEDIHRYR